MTFTAQSGIITANRSSEQGTTLPRNNSSNQKAPKSQGNKHDETVKSVVDRFTKSWNYTQPNYHNRWEEAWKLYNNKRVKQSYEGVSNVFVPVTFSTVETMVAALAGGKPQFDYLPPRENPDQNTEILNSLLDYYWDKDQWNIKVQSWIRSMLLYGTGVIYLQWYMDHPVMVNIPLRDFFFDPNAVSIENCGSSFYCGRRYLTTKEELESFEVVDPTTGEMVKKYQNLDLVTGGKTAQDETDKEKKDMFYGSTVNDPENSQVEVIELWTEDKVISIANRSVLIEDSENPYLTKSKEVYGEDSAKGIIPFIVQRDYVDESLFLGRGEVEIIADLQEDLNDFTNQKRDFFSYILNPMWNLNPKKADMIEQIAAAPGTVFPLDPNDLTPVPMPMFPNSAFNEEQTIENKIRETTAVDQIVKGVNQDTTTTATEVNAQIASAGQRLGMKITQLENEGFHRLARVVFEMIKLYQNSPMIVRVITDKSENQVFDPAEFMVGEYEPRVQLQNSVEAKKGEDRAKAQEMYLALAADPTVNQEELKRISLPRIWDIDPDEVDRLLTAPEMGMNPMEDPLAMGMPEAIAPQEEMVTDPLMGMPL